MIFEPVTFPVLAAAIPEHSVYPADAYTEAAARGDRIGRRYRRGLAWAEAEGYAWRHLSVASVNFVGDRFWQCQGFEPFLRTLQRLVDERIAWTRG